MFKVILKRFSRAFISGGLASMAAMLATGVQVKDLTEINHLLFTLGIAFISGGLLALDKAVRYELPAEE
jgi:Na+-transporting NADH:ubiquinone oxidoreductase subunit NqrE